MRLFAAVMPPPVVLDHLERALTAVRGGADPGDVRGPLRWTAPQDRHLTLAFYGEVPDGRLRELAEGLDGVAGAVAPFSVALRGAGVFDHRTVWMGCADPVAGLQRLSRGATAVGEASLGRRDDRVRSRAHLTVARVPGRVRAQRPARGERRGPAAATGDVAGLVHALALYEGPSWTVAEAVLVASRLGAGEGGHPVHEVVHRAALGPVAG